MTIQQQQRDNLFNALGLFIDAFRPYVVSLLAVQAGDRWPAEYVKCLSPDQQRSWNEGLRSGKDLMGLIDYHHFKSFAIKNRELLRPDFGKNWGNVPNWLGEIADVRHKIAHYDSALEDDEATKAWIHLRAIAKAIKMTELEADLIKLEGKKEPVVVVAPPTVPRTVPLKAIAKPWFRTVTPHSDIRQGRLDESVFAANLAEVALGNGREMYNNPVIFFSKTFFTAGLKTVARTVIRGLNGSEDAENRVISLQTGFGGGKTHTLISLYHICAWGKQAAQSTYTEDLLAYTGKPEFDRAKIAVFTNTTNDVANGRKIDDEITIRTIWGELAYQLGGKEAYEIVRKNDEQFIAPAGLFKKVLELTKPALILIDELADYCVKASARKAGNSSLADQTISFMQELTEAVAGTNHCVAVITLPASPQEVGNTPEAQAILNSLQKRVSRVGADTQPVADDEIYEVIRRRLFEEIGEPEEIEAVVAQYYTLYQQSSVELPGNATKSEYRKRLLKSYPFHPELIDVFRVRWASNSDFQRTRGVLRLLAAIVSDLWKRQQSLPGGNLLIHSGHLNFANLDAMSGQLKRLYGNGYDAVISADVAGSSSNAAKIDDNKPDYGQWYLTQAVATVILLNSFGSEGSNKGISVAEIKLNLLIPEGYNHNSINGALDELENTAYYLYYAQTGGNGKRYWFNTKPNINILINQAKSDIKNEEVDTEILKLLKQRTAKTTAFNVIIDPAEDLPEQTKPTLIILSPQHLAGGGSLGPATQRLIEKIATKKGNSERVYRNTILYLLAAESIIGKLQSPLREYLACHKINQDYQSQLEKEQRADLSKRMEDALKQAEVALAAAYSIVIKHSAKNGMEPLVIKQFKDQFDSQIDTHLLGALKEEEWLLESVGLGTFKKHNLLPTPEQPLMAKAVFEAFIRYDDKPMITSREAVANSLLKYCFNGEYAIATGDGTNFTRYFFKEQAQLFDISDITYWLVDKSSLPAPKEAPAPVSNETGAAGAPISTVQESAPTTEIGKQAEAGTPKPLKAITISGKVPLERYTELFNYFITPFAMTGNKIEIEVNFKINSTTGSPIDESKQQYKSAKEAAKQLGLNFEEDI